MQSSPPVAMARPEASEIGTVYVGVGDGNRPGAHVVPLKCRMVLMLAPVLRRVE